MSRNIFISIKKGDHSALIKQMKRFHYRMLMPETGFSRKLPEILDGLDQPLFNRDFWFP
jgi:hypothetical protein